MSATRPDRSLVLGAVLIGGSSRRMGETKALVMVDGVPMARRVADALQRGDAGRVVVVGGDTATAATLWLDGVPDRWPRQGPLAGIASALLDAPGEQPYVVVAGCDQPDLSPALVARLTEALHAAAPEVVIAVPVTPDGRRHPLPTAWRRSAGPAVAELIAAGAQRTDAPFDVLGVVEVPAELVELVDLDTPEDLEARGEDGPIVWRD